MITLYPKNVISERLYALGLWREKKNNYWRYKQFQLFHFQTADNLWLDEN